MAASGEAVPGREAASGTARVAEWMGRSPVQNAAAWSRFEGLAPGRQVRCGFCQQLLEVPYLPRVPAGPWKRRRFGRSRVVHLDAWEPIGAILAVLFVVGGLQYVKKHSGRSRRGDSEAPRRPPGA